MNKNKKIALTLALAALTILGLDYVPDKEVDTLGGGTDISQCYPTAGAATTTTTYLSGNNATSTGYIDDCFVANADSLDLNFYYGATTTTSVLNLQLQWSHNGNDWFTETLATAEGNNLTISAGPGNAVRRYPLTFNGTTTKNVTITPVAARYLRVNAQSSDGQGGYLWLQVSKREGNK